MGFVTSRPKVRSIDFLDQAGDPATLGRMQRNGDIVKFYDGAVVSQLASEVPKVKASGETVNNSNTLQNDNDLVFSVGASEVWEFLLICQYTSNTTPDFKFDFTGPTGAAMDASYMLFALTLTATLAGNLGFGATVTGGGSTGVDAFGLNVWGRVAVGVNAGNVQFRWAQNTADLSDTIVQAGSRLYARRIS